MLQISNKKLQTLEEICAMNPLISRISVWKLLKEAEQEGLVIYQDQKTGGRPRRRWMAIKNE